MAVVSLDSASFEMFLNKPIKQFDKDLSGSDVKNILYEYELYKKKTSPRYTNKSIRINIEKLEKNFNISLMPMKITEEFYTYFYVFLVNEGCAPSTIKTYFNQIRVALRWGMNHNVQVPSTFGTFTIPKYEKTKVALTPDEISLITYYDIPKNFSHTEVSGKKSKAIVWDTLSRVRDQFVLQCNLGQRYSDISRITPSCFSADKNIFTIIQQKTGNKAVVDISKYSFNRRVTREILERYDYYSPYPHHISNFNHYLHILLKKIGGPFNDIIKTENKIRGQIVTIEKPKYECIASHTARRSFATFNIERGITEARVRHCTGHLDSRSFCKYIIFGDE